MSRWLALADHLEKGIQSSLDNMTKPDKIPSVQLQGVFCQVLSNCQTGIEEKSRTQPPVLPRWSVGGRPMTQTGRIVSIQEWRRMSRGESPQ